MIRAAFFDVDFTLIYPGPTFTGSGYARFCARYGMTIDADRFEQAVAGASRVLDDRTDLLYDPQAFVDYTKAIITALGGVGPHLDACAREMYTEWAACPQARATTLSTRTGGVSMTALSPEAACCLVALPAFC